MQIFFVFGGGGTMVVKANFVLVQVVSLI